MDPLNVVYLHGGRDSVVIGYDAKDKTFTVPNEHVLKWTLLNVNDFPHSKNPRLPYVFDLHWDVKRVSQLQYAKSDEIEPIQQALREHFGNSASINDLEGLATIVRAHNDLRNGYVHKKDSPYKGPTFR